MESLGDVVCIQKKYLIAIIICSLACIMSSCGLEKTNIGSTNIESDISVAKNDLMLMSRLLNDDIEIVTGLNTNYERRFYFKDDKIKHGTDIDELLSYTEFFIFDVNQDGINEIGVDGRMYRYCSDFDVLEVIHDGSNYNYYGKGRIMEYNLSAGSTQYNYIIIDNEYNLLSSFLFKVLYWTGTEEYEYSINGVEVTKHQWEQLKQPFLEWEKEAPQAYTYQEILDMIELASS